MVPQSSEDSVYRQQVGSGETHKGLYAMHSFRLSQEGRLTEDRLCRNYGPEELTYAFPAF
jgi:hypothetical protein